MKINYRDTKSNIALYSFLFALAWGIYLFYIMPLADQVTGACEGTPGHDYKGAIIVLPLYFALFGYWIFYLVRNLKSKLMKLMISILILLLLPLMVTFMLLSFFLNEAVISFIRQQHAFDLFYKYGCYGDIDVRNSCLAVLTALCIWIFVFCTRYFRTTR